MFKTRSVKGEETRRRILETALGLFRTRGFDATTMREVAVEAGQSLGAAYHYFPSKEAIVLAYYDSVQDEHARRIAETLAAGGALRERLTAVFLSKLDILEQDRPLMGALLRYTGDPRHPLSFLGPGTRQLQLRSTALFRDAIARERFPDDIRALLPTLLWAMHMGILLYFIYDDSPRQRRTRALTEAAVALVVRALGVARLPVLRPIRRSVSQLLDDAGLVADDAQILRAVADHPQEVLR